MSEWRVSGGSARTIVTPELCAHRGSEPTAPHFSPQAWVMPLLGEPSVGGSWLRGPVEAVVLLLARPALPIPAALLRGPARRV